eukprot:RCo023752
MDALFVVRRGESQNERVDMRMPPPGQPFGVDEFRQQLVARLTLPAVRPEPGDVLQYWDESFQEWVAVTRSQDIPVPRGKLRFLPAQSPAYSQGSGVWITAPPAMSPKSPMRVGVSPGAGSSRGTSPYTPYTQREAYISALQRRIEELEFQLSDRPPSGVSVLPSGGLVVSQHLPGATKQLRVQLPPVEGPEGSATAVAQEVSVTVPIDRRVELEVARSPRGVVLPPTADSGPSPRAIPAPPYPAATRPPPNPLPLPPP